MLWVIAVLLWGNFAIATYMLIELFRIPTTGSLDEVFTRKRPGSIPLPATLAALGAVVYLASARSLFAGAP